jgi:hypothetical protein
MMRVAGQEGSIPPRLARPRVPQQGDALERAVNGPTARERLCNAPTHGQQPPTATSSRAFPLHAPARPLRSVDAAPAHRHTSCRCHRRTGRSAAAGVTRTSRPVESEMQTVSADVAPTIRTRTNPLVFVVGCQRSGTTMLQRMLDAHPMLAVAYDSLFITRAIKGEPVGFDPPLTDEIVGLARTHPPVRSAGAFCGSRGSGRCRRRRVQRVRHEDLRRTCENARQAAGRREEPRILQAPAASARPDALGEDRASDPRRGATSRSRSGTGARVQPSSSSRSTSRSAPRPCGGAGM